MQATKPKQVRINIDDASAEVLDQVTQSVPMSETQIMTILLEAAARAVRENGFRIPLPLVFEIAAPPERSAATRLPGGRSK